MNRFRDYSRLTRYIDLAQGPSGLSLSPTLFEEFIRACGDDGSPFENVKGVVIPLQSYHKIYTSVFSTHITLLIHPAATLEEQNKINRALKSLICDCRTVTHLVLDPLRHSLVFTEEIVMLLDQLPNLQSLSMPLQVLSGRLLRATMRCKTLQHLTAINDRRDRLVVDNTLDHRSVEDESADATLHRNPHVTILTFEACFVSSAHAHNVLCNPSFPAANIIALGLRFLHGKGSLRVDLHSILKTVAEVCSNVQHLSIAFLRFSRSGERPKKAGKDSIALREIWPVVNMKQLRGLYIDHPVQIDMSQDDLLCFVQSCPNLESLALCPCPRGPIVREKLLRLHSMTSLAKCTPSLKALAVCIDCSDVSCEVSVDHHFSSLQHLFLGTSPIWRKSSDGEPYNDWASLASFISDILPPYCQLLTAVNCDEGVVTSGNHLRWTHDCAIPLLRGWSITSDMVNALRVEKKAKANRKERLLRDIAVLERQFRTVEIGDM